MSKPKQKEYFILDEKNKVLKRKIDEQPGIHLYELHKATGYTRSVIWYRLEKMDRVNLIKLVRGKLSLRCYPATARIPDEVIPEYIPLVDGVIAGGQ